MNPNVIQFCCFALDGKCEFANICIENGIDVRYDEEMRNVPKNSTKYAWEKCCEKCYERENAGLRQRGPTNLYFNETNTDTDTDTVERDISCYNKQSAPPNGCALCEKKETPRWRKNTDTGERDICDRCYRKHRRAIRMAPPNGCVISVWHWCTNTETGEIDICNTCYRQ